MSEQDGTERVTLQRPFRDDREEWKVYWQRHGQEWRSEPEIDKERQGYLAERRALEPVVKQGIYPFKDIKLSRADVEWLLATHENGRGPVDYSDESQRQRVGIDLRGADLRGVHLQNLPLACTIGDVTWRQWFDLTEEQHIMAAVHLERADLKGAYLEGASLEYAHLEGADLRQSHLEQINLGEADLQRAYLEGAHLEGSDLWLAHLDGAFLWATYLARANLSEAHLQEAHLDNRVTLVDDQRVGPKLVDAHLGEVNIAGVRWSQINMLSDEYEARQKERAGEVKDKETRLREYDEAVRANRQLAIALQAQGLNEDAAYFSYRAQVLQRKVLWMQGPGKVGSYLFSLLLALLTGYGYRMWRIVVAYAFVNVVFASLYYSLGLSYAPHYTWTQALIVSITAFHGRVFSNSFLPGSPQSTVTAFEAVTGLIFEGTFIAMLTQRFFGK